MININAPFIIALTVIIFLVVIKWIEWFLFQNGSFPARPKRQKTQIEIKEIKDTKLAVFGRRLKDLLFFGKADLKKPWYGGLPFAVIIIAHNIMVNFLNISFWTDMVFFLIGIFAAGMFSIFAVLRANKEFFRVDDRRRRYIRTQLAQACLTLIIVAAAVSGLLIYSNHNDPDPPGLKESVDWVIEPVYEAEWPEFSEGLAAVGYRGEKGFIDQNGNTVIPFQYNDAGNFSDGLAAVQKDWRWGYIDQKGKVVIPFQYEEAFEFDGGIAPVKKDGKWRVIDMTGNVKFTTDYQLIQPFHEGFAKVEIQDKEHSARYTEDLIDTEGKRVFHNGYTLLGNFSEGCIVAMDNQTNLNYYLNKDGEKTIPQGYVDATDFSCGVAAVLYEGGVHALIDHNGAVIRKLSEEEFYNIVSVQEGLVETNNGEWDGYMGNTEKLRYGFEDVYGNIMVPVSFRSATASSEGLIGLEVDGHWGFIANPLPDAARGANPELWNADRTQIATVEGLPVYAGELENLAYSMKKSSPELAGLPLYQTAFEQIKSEKAFEKYGKNIDQKKIRYQIGDTYYKKLLLPDIT